MNVTTTSKNSAYDLEPIAENPGSKRRSRRRNTIHKAGTTVMPIKTA